MFKNADSADAIRVEYMECDDEECIMVEAEKDWSGVWKPNKHVHGAPVSRTILMMETDDDN